MLKRRKKKKMKVVMLFLKWGTNLNESKTQMTPKSKSRPVKIPRKDHYYLQLKRFIQRFKNI